MMAGTLGRALGGGARQFEAARAWCPITREGAMSQFEVSARMKVRLGQLEGFKRQAAECIGVTREKDTRTLRYDWYLSSDGTECEIREAYADSEGFLEHRINVGDALSRLFAEFADDHRVSVFGEVSDQLVEYANANMPPGSVRWYHFLGGIGSVPGDQPVQRPIRKGRLQGEVRP
jgi:quinol monooxygenase YgiN